MLLDAGCDVNATYSYDDNTTPLICAAKGGSFECVQSLLQRGADVHKRTRFGCTPAHYAAQHGNTEMLLALLDAGCYVNATDTNSEYHFSPDKKPHEFFHATPLMYAAKGNHTACVQLLLQRGADVHEGDGGGKAIHYAALHGNKEMLLALLDAGCYMAAEKINAEEDGWDVDEEAYCRGPYHMVTPLMLAAHWELRQQPKEGHADCVRLLLQRGADATRRVLPMDTTLAHNAAECGDVEMLLALLDAGCPVDHQDNHERTPLHCAASEGHVDCMQLLLERGADPKCFSDRYGLPVHCAALHSTDALRAMFALLVELPLLDEVFRDSSLRYYDPNYRRAEEAAVSLGLACGCCLKSTLSSIEQPADFSLLPVLLDYYSLPYAL